MFNSFAYAYRLAKAGRTLARYDALLLPEQIAELPGLARLGLKLAKFGSRSPEMDAKGRLVLALSALGPSYIKLGQFLATRPDLVGPRRAFELKALQDRLPPFGMEEARAAIRANLDADVDALFTEFGPPVAAASIAQVHRAKAKDGRDLAVKILRPGIEKRFAADLASFFFAARLLEKVSAEGRRLRPVEAVAVLRHSMTLELDLRMEASAIAEMTANTRNDPGLRMPKVDWQLTSKQVLTTDWIEGTPISYVAALQARGLNLAALGDLVIQSFLRHAIHDGFFHADMHQGNLLIDPDGRLAIVDFGIMGRLSEKDRLFLAEILFGFITRDYMRVSLVHFDAGYVPGGQDPANFAQALRAIGEPIMDKPAREISMARLLTQLFEVTGQFNMVMQPQLLLLQKTMVVVEGVARMLNPDLNMWVTAEPVVRQWIERRLGPAGQIEGAISSFGHMATSLPGMFDDAQKAAAMLAGMAQSGGLRLDQETTEELARAQSRHGRWHRFALMAGAAALVVIAIKLIF